MMARRRQAPAGPDAESPISVPAVLPHVVMTVAADGSMTVTVDGVGFDPNSFAKVWRREGFATILEAITRQRRTPVRVEVHEADGSVFTDLVTPAPDAGRPPIPPPPAPAGRPARPGRRILAGEGFLPGEEVAVGLVAAHVRAAPDGTARAVLPARPTSVAPAGEVILFGRVSGTMLIGRPE